MTPTTVAGIVTGAGRGTNTHRWQNYIGGACKNCNAARRAVAEFLVQLYRVYGQSITLLINEYALYRWELTSRGASGRKKKLF